MIVVVVGSLLLPVAVVGLLLSGVLSPARVSLGTSGETLHVRLGRPDSWLALKSELDVPKSSITRVVADPDPRMPNGAIRMPGTSIVGLITAGTYVVRRGPKEFWDVRKRGRAVAIELRDHPFTRIVVEVDDPKAVVDRVTRWLEA
jgi:hypothetical protein